MKNFKMFVLSCCVPAVAFCFANPALAAELEVEIKSVYELRDATLYFDGDAPEDIPYYDEGNPVIFVYEYPVFDGEGNAAKKINAVYEAQRKNKNAERSIAGAKEFKREQAAYTEEDYFDALRTKKGNFFDITTCSVFKKGGVVSVKQVSGWLMGGVHSLVSEFHTFELATGHELEITDVFKGSKDAIVEKLQKAYEAEYDDQVEEPGELKFVLTGNGVECDLDSPIAAQNGALVTIPYSADFVKAPFSK
jgi:hypothetical protein